MSRTIPITTVSGSSLKFGPCTFKRHDVANSVAWPHFLDSYCQIDPVSQAVSEINQTVVLQDFTVSSHLF